MSNTLKNFIIVLLVIFLGLNFYLDYNNKTFNNKGTQAELLNNKLFSRSDFLEDNYGDDISIEYQKEGLVELYAKLKHFTSSGGMKFYYYDIDKGEIINNSNGNFWFWGGVFENEKLIDNFVNYIEEDKNSVFKIVGIRDNDDCDYLEGFCFEDINIEKIERLK